MGTAADPTSGAADEAGGAQSTNVDQKADGIHFGQFAPARDQRRRTEPPSNFAMGRAFQSFLGVKPKSSVGEPDAPLPKGSGWVRMGELFLVFRHSQELGIPLECLLPVHALFKSEAALSRRPRATRDLH
jgi:hypothetical protein